MRELEYHFLFYSDNITNDNIVFDDIETRHITNVLRLSKGDKIKVTNGKGAIFTVELEVISKKSAIGRIVEKEISNKLQKLNLYIGIPEKDSMERLLPMIIPQGVDIITPVICDFCQKAWWENKWDKSLDRFHRVIVTSVKQSWNDTIPLIAQPITFKEFIDKDLSNLFFADEDGILSKDINYQNNSICSINCIIGPPGGFSPSEKSKLKELGTGIKLSDFRLRTELAGSLIISALYSAGVINLLEKKRN